ncbi:MAG TPA: hypothetical protein VH351_14695 [Bryobacteraceae bacterium]|nr:hypothetical protein [Bryobacteraceae bacterium]
MNETTLVELTTPEVQHPDSSHRVRLIGLAAVVVLLGAVGNLSLAWGMKHIAISMGLRPLAYVHALASPFVGLGVVLLVLWLLTRMALLSRSDLSFVLPATGIGYVLNAVLAALVLKEFISPYRWLGTLLILAGAALVGSDPKGLSTSGACPERAPEN